MPARLDARLRRLAAQAKDLSALPGGGLAA
jgi:hypothetical protein